MRVLPVIVVCVAGLAGCLSADSGPPDLTRENVEAGAGGGTITGLLVDDRFRPIHLGPAGKEAPVEGFVLLQPTGAQAATSANGEFSFSGLEAGRYTLRTAAAGHEAVPVDVDVPAEGVVEVTIVARRTDSGGGALVTEEYAVFIPCGVDYVVDGIVDDCTLDQSGDSYRPGFTVDYTGYGNVTHLVSEMRADRADRYEVQVREDDGTGPGGARMAVAQFEGDYVKIALTVGETDSVWDGQGDNAPWRNDFPLKTILFRDSPGREEVQGLGVPACCGAGAYVAVKARFVQTVILGDAADPAAYCILC